MAFLFPSEVIPCPILFLSDSPLASGFYQAFGLTLRAGVN
jgi:hypothetical protein